MISLWILIGIIVIVAIYIGVGVVRDLIQVWREDECDLPKPVPDERSSIELFKRMHDVE